MISQHWLVPSGKKYNAPSIHHTAYITTFLYSRSLHPHPRLPPYTYWHTVCNTHTHSMSLCVGNPLVTSGFPSQRDSDYLHTYIHNTDTVFATPTPTQCPFVGGIHWSVVTSGFPSQRDNAYLHTYIHNTDTLFATPIPAHCPFVWRNHQSPVDSPHKRPVLSSLHT